MYTVTEAAERLGVSRRRVYELIKDGSISASRFGNSWMVDDASLSARASTVNKRGGRPAKGSGRHEHRYTLMNRTYEVAELVYHDAAEAFTVVSEEKDLSRAPLGVLVRGPRFLAGAGTRDAGHINLAALNEWWRGKGLSANRPDLARLLADAGVDVSEKLILRNLGLSLSDQYWIRPANSGLTWENINFFTNGFDDAGFLLGASGTSIHPDNTSDGVMPKHWCISDGRRVLLKGGTALLQEPCNEVIATELGRRLLTPGEFVPYTLTRERGPLESACPLFLTDTEEYIPAALVENTLEGSEYADPYHRYVTVCRQLGIADAEARLSRMIVIDDLMANTDRHWRNFGIVRDVETLECRIAPIFDTGTSLWCNREDLLLARDYTFEGRQFDPHPGRQLQYADVSWVDCAKLAGMPEFARGVLAESLLPPERIDRVCEGVAWRIARMERICDVW